MSWPRWHDEVSAYWTDEEGRPIVIVEITFRVHEGRMELTPTKRNNGLMLGVMGRAQELYGFSFYGIGLMTNHGSYLIGVRSAAHQALIMQFIHSNISREVGWHGEHGSFSIETKTHQPYLKKAKLLGRRGTPIAVTTEAEAVARLKYLLSNGTKEGLVRSPQQSVHVNSGRALCAGDRMHHGVWVDRTELGELRRKYGAQVPESDATTHYTIKLAKLPHLRHLSDEEYAKFCRGLCDEIVAEAREKFGPGYHPPSPRKLRNIDPRTRTPLETTPPPMIHSKDQEQRKSYYERRAVFRERFQIANAELKASVQEGRPFRGEFPPGCIRPGDRLSA